MKLEQTIGHQMWSAATAAVTAIDKAIDEVGRQPSVIVWLVYVPRLKLKRRKWARIAAAYEHCAS